MTHPNQAPQSPGTAAFASLSQFERDNLAEFNAAMAENLSRLYSEWMQFVSHRLREDASLQQKIMACRSLEEAQAVHAAFLRRAMEEYSDETQKLMRMSHNMMAEALDRLHG